MQYWLIKSEESCYSIDDLKKDKKTPWSGVRNYQARNFMRDSMKKGDLVLFYHSNGNPPHIAGVAKVGSAPYEDKTAFDRKDDHFDPKATKENSIWCVVDMVFVSKFKNTVTLPEIKRNPVLVHMVLTQRGSRLSVQPVSEKEFITIKEMSND